MVLKEVIFDNLHIGRVWYLERLIFNNFDFREVCWSWKK